jgi:hypothetical protein
MGRYTQERIVSIRSRWAERATRRYLRGLGRVRTMAGLERVAVAAWQLGHSYERALSDYVYPPQGGGYDWNWRPPFAEYERAASYCLRHATIDWQTWEIDAFLSLRDTRIREWQGYVAAGKWGHSLALYALAKSLGLISNTSNQKRSKNR